MSTSAGAAFRVIKERGGAMRGFKGYILILSLYLL